MLNFPALLTSMQNNGIIVLYKKYTKEVCYMTTEKKRNPDNRRNHNKTKGKFY